MTQDAFGLERGNVCFDQRFPRQIQPAEDSIFIEVPQDVGQL
jgi:hypothetical protein